MPNEKRLITAEDLYTLNKLSQPQISPDGQHIIYCQQRIDRKTEKKYSNLWLVSTAGSAPPRQFSYGDQSDSMPRWSPDGSEIAFISNRANEEQPQLYIIPFYGGEARPVSDMKGEFGSLAWAPDGKKLVCQFRKKDAEAIEREKDEQKKKLGVISRHISRTFFKLDGEGFLPDERWHLWLINAESGEATQLTDSPIFDEENPAFSPDGAQIVFTSNRSDDPDMHPDAVDICLISVNGGQITVLPTPYGGKRLPQFSPDGKTIAYLAEQGRGNWWQNTHLWVIPADGLSEARNLTHRFDFTASHCTINDTSALYQNPPLWSANGQRIFFQASERGSTHLKSINLKGEDLQTVIEGPGVAGQFSLNQTSNKLAYAFDEMDQLSQIYVKDFSNGKSKGLTQINAPLLAEISLGQMEELWFKGPEDNDLQGWILKPPHFDAAKSYPAIIEIHGGPLGQYGYSFMHEFYFLAAQGYVVAFCNPRGGQGYGEAHAKAIWNSWGQADYADVMAFTELVAQKAYVDADRMGVTGGSYGGFLTNWIIGQTAHFKAAVTQRSVSNQLSAWGSTDFNWVFQMEIGDDQPPWENLAGYWERSPLKYIGNAKTPTLIIHSEQDLRCVLEQGEQIYVALKRLGVETELVLFPDEPHGLSRIGRTDRRIERLNHMLRWFDRFLKDS